MDNERWEQLLNNIKSKFPVEEEGLEDILGDVAMGQSKQGEEQFIVVKTPLGKIKLAREIRPRVLEKKFHYSHRQGTSAQTEYKFSETEKTYKLKIYKWNEQEDDWEELNSDSLGGFIK